MPSALEALEALDSLLATPCFDLAVEHPRLEWPGSALAMRTWWISGGGEWLASYLRGRRDQILLPPDVREAMTAETVAGHTSMPEAIRSLACPEADERCGVETEAWARAAARAFDRYTRAFPNRCAQAARVGRRATRYQRWRECMTDVGRRPAWPLGRFRAPTDGWLVVRGSGRLDILDLTTGAAYFSRARGCRGCTVEAAQRPSESQAGQVPVNRLREAALATFLARHSEEGVRVEARRISLPHGLTPEWIPAETHIVSPGVGGFGCVHDYSGRWLWIQDGAVLARGSLEYRCGRGAAAYAVDLLGKTTDAFLPGCPPAKPPWPLPDRTEQRSHLDDLIEPVVKSAPCPPER